MEPDSEETRMILEPRVRREAAWREWTMKGGEMEEVVYILTCSSHLGPEEKSSVAK